MHRKTHISETMLNFPSFQQLKGIKYMNHQIFWLGFLCLVGFLKLCCLSWCQSLWKIFEILVFLPRPTALSIHTQLSATRLFFGVHPPGCLKAGNWGRTPHWAATQWALGTRWAQPRLSPWCSGTDSGEAAQTHLKPGGVQYCKGAPADIYRPYSTIPTPARATWSPAGI